jgi:serine/threonine protein kinase
MEFVEEGDLAGHLEEIKEETDIRTISLQLLCALRVMHEKGLIHRDVKPKVD